jgi:Aspartyl/Asparaginyl beta-hydroxylase
MAIFLFERDAQQQDLPLAVCLLSVLVGTLCFWSYLAKHRRDDDPYSIQPCANPQCVRCRRYAVVQRQAVRKLPWIVQESSANLDRVSEGVRRFDDKNGRTSSSSSSTTRRSRRTATTMSPALGQYPTVLLVPRLVALPNVTAMHRNSCRLLEASASAIQAELLHRSSSSAESVGIIWTHNDVSPPSSWSRSQKNGKTPKPWKVLYLMNQGRWSHDMVRLFPQTWAAVAALRDNGDDALLDSCLFGNVFFSRLAHGTAIDVHCGPTNVRHRLHLTVQYDNNSTATNDGSESSSSSPPAAMTLHVRDEVMTWSQHKTFVFDDSLPHYVTGGGGNSIERIVLIVDLWHPDLTASERDALRQLYPNNNK